MLLSFSKPYSFPVSVTSGLKLIKLFTASPHWCTLTGQFARSDARPGQIPYKRWWPELAWHVSSRLSSWLSCFVSVHVTRIAPSCFQLVEDLAWMVLFVYCFPCIMSTIVRLRVSVTLVYPIGLVVNLCLRYYRLDACCDCAHGLRELRLALHLFLCSHQLHNAGYHPHVSQYKVYLKFHLVSPCPAGCSIRIQSSNKHELSLRYFLQ